MNTEKGVCQVCNENLREEDDAVTCPACGAPYHRQCYTENGGCVYQDKHAIGYEYPQPEKQATPKAEASGSTKSEKEPPSGVVCKNCSTINDSANIFCENCGIALRAPQQGYERSSAPPPNFGRTNMGGTQQASYAQNTELGGDLDGISKSDWAMFIGRSAPTYLRKISYLSRQKYKISFMASALFLGPFYLAYRKMWGLTALALGLYMLFMVPQMLQIGLDSGVVLIPALTQEALSVLHMVVYYASLVLRLLLSLFSLQFYRKNAIKKINNVRKQGKQGHEYHTALMRAGGVSILGVLAVIALNFAFFTLWYYLMGDAMMLYYYPELMSTIA